MAEYVLMNKENKVARLLYDNNTHKAVKILEVYDLRYAPPGALNVAGEMNGISFSAWFERRAIPASRAHIQNVLERLSLKSTLDLAERNFGLSLSDQYWLNSVEEPVKWKDINFFDNDFSEDLGFLTLGYNEHFKGNIDLFSPNSTLGGDLEKKWTIINGERILLKSGSGFVRQEVYNEVIAACLHKRLLSPEEYVPYWFYETGNEITCACRNMLSDNEELVSAYDLTECRKKRNDESMYQFTVRCFKEAGLDDIETFFCKMFACDFILANEDRHYRNFGAIRNVETLEYIRPAPIFDTGTSLWCRNAHIRRLDGTFLHTAKPFKSGGENPLRQLERFSDYAWFEPDRLHGFVADVGDILLRNPNMPQNRIDIICQNVEENIKTLKEFIRK